MKSLSISLLSVVVLLSLNSCKKWSDKKYSTTITTSFLVDISSTDPKIIDLDQSVTALINTELAAVKDNIKSYKLVSINYKIFEFWSDEVGKDVLYNGTIGIGNKNATEAGVVHTFFDVSLLSGNDDPNRVNILFNSQDIKRIEQYFFDTNGLRLFLDGTISSTPVHFVLQLQINIDAIANTKG